jgi:uncharacterized protein (TIGR02246 family)
MEQELKGTVLQNDILSIQTLYKQLINSWNEMDSEAFANFYTTDGSIVGFDGSQANGRQEIYDHLSSIFADHAPARFVTIIREVRILSSAVVLLRAIAGMVPRNGKEINAKTNAVQSLIGVKQGEHFRIALFQNTPAALHGREEESAKLTKELQEQFDQKGLG